MALQKLRGRSYGQRFQWHVVPQEIGYPCSGFVHHRLRDLLHDDDTQFPAKRKGRKFRQFGLKCPKTKVMKTHVAEGKSEEDVCEHFWKAKQSFKPSYTPESIRTDNKERISSLRQYCAGAGMERIVGMEKKLHKNSQHAEEDASRSDRAQKGLMV